MAAADKLEAALTSIGWSKNVSDFLADGTAKERLAARNLRLAIWSRQLEMVDAGNPALTFIREMQTAGQNATALTALGMYKAAAAAARAMIETALYYTYFRSHHEELATLLRSTDFYVEKRDVIDYHRSHTVGFKEKQAASGLLSKLDRIYSSLSAIIHGQIPGVWTAEFKSTSFDPSRCANVVDHFERAEEVVHLLFLTTVGPLFWADFSNAAKSHLLKGISKDVVAVLDLDKA